MKLLPDTHLLLWAANLSPKLSPAAKAMMDNPEHELFFSMASIWETSIKHALGKPDFIVHPRTLYQGLLAYGYRELGINSEHAIAVGNLPLLHRDPFDRLLVAQANVERITLLTADSELSRYPGVLLV